MDSNLNIVNEATTDTKIETNYAEEYKKQQQSQNQEAANETRTQQLQKLKETIVKVDELAKECQPDYVVAAALTKCNFYPDILDNPTEYVAIPEEVLDFYLRFYDKVKDEIEIFEACDVNFNVPLPLWAEVPGGLYKLIIWWIHPDYDHKKYKGRQELIPCSIQLLPCDEHPINFGNLKAVKDFGIDLEMVMFNIHTSKHKSRPIPLIGIFKHIDEFQFVQAPYLSGTHLLELAYLLGGTDRMIEPYYSESVCIALGLDELADKYSKDSGSTKSMKNIPVKVLQAHVKQFDYQGRLLANGVPDNFLYISQMMDIGKSWKYCHQFEYQFKRILPKLITIRSIVSKNSENGMYFDCWVQNAKHETQRNDSDLAKMYYRNYWNVCEPFRFQLPFIYVHIHAPELFKAALPKPDALLTHLFGATGIDPNIALLNVKQPKQKIVNELKHKNEKGENALKEMTMLEHANNKHKIARKFKSRLPPSSAEKQQLAENEKLNKVLSSTKKSSTTNSNSLQQNNVIMGNVQEFFSNHDK